MAAAVAHDEASRTALAIDPRLDQVDRFTEALVEAGADVNIADKQGAKLPKLRAATSFARLLADKGKPVQARALLRPPYDAISEGLDLTDVKAAAALLAELGDR